jgi:ribosomal protein L21
MTKAIIKLSGREVLVSVNEKIVTFNLKTEEKENITIPAILSFDDQGNIIKEKTQVELHIKRNFLGKKVESVKRKNRTRTFRTRGSRPHLTTVEVKKIIRGGK